MCLRVRHTSNRQPYRRKIPCLQRDFRHGDFEFPLVCIRHILRKIRHNMFRLEVTKHTEGTTRNSLLVFFCLQGSAEMVLQFQFLILCISCSRPDLNKSPFRLLNLWGNRKSKFRGPRLRLLTILKCSFSHYLYQKEEWATSGSLLIKFMFLSAYPPNKLCFVTSTSFPSRKLLCCSSLPFCLQVSKFVLLEFGVTIGPRIGVLRRGSSSLSTKEKTAT